MLPRNFTGLVFIGKLGSIFLPDNSD